MKATFLLSVCFFSTVTAVAWEPSNAATPSCADFRQQVDLSERFYREWQVYRNESESDLADAEQKNLRHSLDLATLDVAECSDKSALLRYYRVKLLLEVDGETLAWAKLADSSQHNFGSYYARLQADFGRANSLGLRKIYPADYTAIKSAIAAESPSAMAQANRRVAQQNANYTKQAQEELAELKARFGAKWQSVLSVSVKDEYIFTYVVASEFWQSLGEMGRPDLEDALKMLAEDTYEKSHCGNKPYQVGIQFNIVDENGSALDTEFPSPDPTPFMQTPSPCSH